MMEAKVYVKFKYEEYMRVIQCASAEELRETWLVLYDADRNIIGRLPMEKIDMWWWCTERMSVGAEIPLQESMAI